MRPKIINDNFKKISEEDRDMLEASLSLDEVKNAIWSCGSHKAPRPDGFTFKFLKEFWDVLKDDIFKFLKEFEGTGELSIGCNAFLSL